jgi:hypothetical protein
MTPAKESAAVHFVDGKVIYHHWDEDHRLVERSQVFRSLEELLAQCLAPPAQHLVDRVVVTGQDPGGRRRQLVLGFQSLTEP